MRKIILATFAMFLLGNMAYASLEKDATSGLFKNEIDRVVDANDILGVKKNVIDFGYTEWDGTATTWKTTFGIISPLPIKIGGNVSYRENISGTPHVSSNTAITWADTNADGIADGKGSVIDIETKYTMDATRNFTGVVGLNNNLGLSYNYSEVLSRNVGNYDVVGGWTGVIVNKYTQNYVGTSLSSETVDLSDPDGYYDNSTYKHTATLGLKLGDKMDLWIPLSYEVSGQEWKGLTSNRTFISAAPAGITTPSESVDTYFKSLKTTSIIVTPKLRLWLTKSKETLLFVDGVFSGGISFRPASSIYEMTTSDAISRTIPVADVSTENIVATNTTYRANYSSIPLSLNVTPVLFKRYEKFRFAVGVSAKVAFTPTSYISFSSNISISNVNLADGASDANDYNIKYLSAVVVTSNFNNVWKLSLTLPAGVEVDITKSITMRFGTVFGLTYDRTAAVVQGGQYTPYSYSRTDGAGTTDTNISGDIDGVIQNDSREITRNITTSVDFSFGMGFEIIENMHLDTMLNITAAGGEVFNFKSWDVELSYRFPGKQKVASAKTPVKKGSKGKGKSKGKSKGKR